MADNAIKSDVFKFVALRPPVSIEKKNQEMNFITDSRQPEKTPVGKLVATFDSKDGTKIPEQVKSFIEANKYDVEYPESIGDFRLAKIYDLVLSITKEDFTNQFLASGIINILDGEIALFLDNEDNTTLLNGIWDRYYAFFILSGTENQNLDNLTKDLRVFHLLSNIIKSKIQDYDTLQNVILAKPLVSKLFSDLPKPLIKIEEPKEEEPNPEKVNQYKKIWSDLINTNRALEEIKNIRFETRLTSEAKDIGTPNKETGIEEKRKLTSLKSILSLYRKDFDNLHSGTKAVLNTLNLSESNFQVAEPIIQLQNKLENLYSTANRISDVEFFRQVPEEAMSIHGLSALTSKKIDIHKPFPFPFLPVTNVRKSIKPLGIGDLKVVKQKLKKYVAGEVAHIENVLRGEYKDRKHRVLDRTEDIFTVTNETEEETTKDSQTTDRFELKKESEKTVQEQMSVQAGVTVSGSYGMVTFGAHGDFAYSTASQESNKSSSNFARDVIDKSISKIQKKTKEERTTKKLHEVEEINTHGIDNKDKADHAVGIYRWVDKYYDAQIYNYGKRMMLEFIIPEPAAFYGYAQTHKPKKDIIAPKPLPENFSYKNIEIWNIDAMIKDYNVQGVTSPSPPFKTISTSITKDAMPIDGNPHVAGTQLVVPAGYISKLGVWFDCSAIFVNFPRLEITIGNKIFRLLEVNGGPGIMKSNYNDASIGWHWFWPESTIQISANIYDIASFTMNAYALVELTYEAKVQWQIQTFEKIMAAYKAMQAEYEQKSAAQEAQQGIAIIGQNPSINREIEKTELKKQSIKMLMDTYLFGSFNAMKDGTIPPDFDIFEALEEGKTIQFFEQAFEWENLTYLFYPYFWARKGQWPHKSTIYDNDPLFTKFLQAGSSRVVVPVRPGYNDMISYYMQTGQIWGKDGNPPLIKKEDGSLNDLFISIADELRNQTDDLGNATAEGEPWEVVLPTTLVYLQKDSDLPTFNN